MRTDNHDNAADPAIERHRRDAADYDRQALDYDWYGPQILFGLAYGQLAPGGRVLDLGIGTGLSSELFARAGFSVTGVDGAAEMLAMCQSKGFAAELLQHDLRQLPLPLADGSFDAVIAAGLLQMFGDPAPLLAEMHRLLKPGGLAALTTLPPAEDDGPDLTCDNIEGINVYSYRDEYFRDLAGELGLAVVCRATALMKSWQHPGELVPYRNWILKR
ncbi:class I SAM-dependent methyltransferase [bacterium]|nr:class I SAM-dependent methyltransferase [bacterium]